MVEITHCQMVSITNEQMVNFLHFLLSDCHFMSFYVDFQIPNFIVLFVFSAIIIVELFLLQ